LVELEDNSTYNLIASDEELSHESRTGNYSVCIVDMVDSTRITSRIGDSKKAVRYYSIFLNSMAAIVRGYGARIIKNVGDSLIYYFPETTEITNWTAYKAMLDSAMKMIVSHKIINEKLLEEKLPSVDYRISADYGKVEIVKSNSSRAEDLFGATINMCAKINLKAHPNSFVIGGDLYRILKTAFPGTTNHFSFKEVGAYSTGLSKSYPVYEVKSKKEVVPNLNFKSPLNHSGNSLSPNCPNIMIVEDQADLAFTYNTILSEEGWKVDFFTDPEDALRHYAEIYPTFYDLVVLDIRMPKLNGLQLFYRLKAITTNVKIMFVSALDAAEELVSILPGLEYSDIIKKPVLRHELISRLKKKLEESEF
jgi:two-component system response regulator ChvI